jgi:capsid portal protein
LGVPPVSRAGYTDDYDSQWDLIRWRGAVKSAIRGKRGQAFLREMLSALDQLPSKRLIDGDMEADGEVCALGAVALARGIAGLHDIDPYDRDRIAQTFGIPPALAAEIMYANDEAAGYWHEETPEQRWQRVRNWIAGKII